MQRDLDEQLSGDKRSTDEQLYTMMVFLDDKLNGSDLSRLKPWEVKSEEMHESFLMNIKNQIETLNVMKRKDSVIGYEL